MGNAITLDSRALWLSLHAHGGWWTAARLTRHWAPTFQEREVAEHLWALHRGGFVARREVPEGRLRITAYAFTDLCRALPGHDLQLERSPV